MYEFYAIFSGFSGKTRIIYDKIVHYRHFVLKTGCFFRNHIIHTKTNGGYYMLELRNVSVSAGGEDGGEHEIIYNASLTLENKKIYVVTGPNGGGKTSLAKAIMGIYPVRCGSLLLDGEDITGKSITERAELGIGYAFQAPTRFKGLRVRDFLSIALNGPNGSSTAPHGPKGSSPAANGPSGSSAASYGPKGSSPAANGPNGSSPSSDEEDERKIYSLLVDVGLCAQDYIDRELNASFSGGELKRVEIASILARELRVALFDEPEAGIDLWSFQKLTETFIQLNESSDTTIVIISHQERILRLADEVILIADGKITGITSPEEILGELEYDDPACVCATCFDKRRGEKIGK